MSRIEREEIQEFVKDQSRRRYIQPSKLPYMPLLFFVPKKNEKKEMV